MKLLLVVVLTLIAVALAVVGVLAGGDPEGRGGKIAGIFLGSAAVVAVMDASLIVYFLI